MQVLSKEWVGYCLTVLGSMSVIALLSPVVLTQTIVIARPHLEGGASPPSLMQRREIDAALSLPPSLTRVTPLVPTEVPTEPLGRYATEMDVAEAQEPLSRSAVATFELQSEPPSIASAPMKLRVARAERASWDVTTRDIFNRSFGVITAETN